MSSTNRGVRGSTGDPRWVVEAVRRIQNGEEVEESFRLLYDHFQPQAERFLRRHGVGTEFVEDLAQEAMLRVYKGIGRFRWRSSFASWTLTIVANIYKNHLRHLDTARVRAERTSVDALLGDHLDGELANLPAGLATDEPDPGSAALYGEVKRRLADTIGGLPPRMRQSFLLRYNGFSYREIARILGVQSDTVKKHLAEARRRLRPIFDLGLVLVAVTAAVFEYI